MATTLTSAPEWAAMEFGGAGLGDRRRQPRLVKLATALAENPHGTLPGSFKHWSEVKAAYRLLEQPDVTYDAVVDPHRHRVRSACGQPGEYLLVEDSTQLDFTSHLAATDLGRIGDDGGRGLFVHSTLALRIERWNEHHEPEVTVEGLFDQRWWARTMPTVGQKEKKQSRLKRARESQRWAAITEQCQPPADAVSWTFLADRESDIYETFARCQSHGWHFIVRAEQPRALADEGGSLFTAVGESPEIGRFFVDLRARPGQKAHRAELTVRVRRVTLRGPWRPEGWLGRQAINVVQARELNAPQGVEPIHWILLTDWPIDSLAAAMRVIKAYTRRWLIEEYHKALKSGTGIESSQLETAQRITVLLGILAVVAVRLLNMKLLAATRPDDPVSEEAIGREALAVLAAEYGQPAGGWTNATVLVAIARLGGFLARRSDGQPGWLTIWRGMRQLIWTSHGYARPPEKNVGNDKGASLRCSRPNDLSPEGAAVGPANGCRTPALPSPPFGGSEFRSAPDRRLAPTALCQRPIRGLEARNGPTIFRSRLGFDKNASP